MEHFSYNGGHSMHGSRCIKPALYKSLLHCNICYKQLYLSNKTECFSYIKVDVAYVNVHVLRHLKEELAWAID